RSARFGDVTDRKVQFEHLLRQALKDDEIIQLAREGESLELVVGNILSEQSVMGKFPIIVWCFRMKCNDARTFMSQIAGKSVTIQVQQSDVNFVSTNGYVSVLQRGDYGQGVAGVANLTQMNDALLNEMVEQRIA